MPITNRNLPAGTRLVAKYKGATYGARILEDGLIELDPRPNESHAKTFKSPSAAGSAIMGGIACNGWRFWSVDGPEPEAATCAFCGAPMRPGDKTDECSHAEGQGGAAATLAAKPKTAKVISRVPNQKGVEEGKTRFWCNGCMKSFLADAGTTPDACPEGHSASTLDAA